MMDAARDGKLPPRTDSRRVPHAPYTPEPVKKSPVEYARDVAKGFKGASSFSGSTPFVYVLESKAILPDEETATKVAAILDRLVKRDVAQRHSMHPDTIDREMKSSTKKTSQGVTFSYKSYDYEYLQGIRWDLIISHIQDKGAASSHDRRW
jgi:hypothetical protein